MQAIELWMNAQNMNRGDGKAQAAAREQKKKASEVIMQFMTQTGNTYIPVGNRYLVIKEKKDCPQLNQEFMAKAYYVFHTVHNGGGPNLSWEQRAIKFSEFVPALQKQVATTVKKLELQKQRPAAAMLSALQAMNGSL